MELDPLLPVVVGVTLIVFLIGIGLRMLNQPHVVGYILAGILIGSSGLDWISDDQVISSLGSIGIVLLLFFIGMQVSIPKLFKRWKVAIIGTAAQILVSVAMMTALGAWLDWPLYLDILLAFVVSLSSTAVILKILEEWGELNTRVGQNVVGILLVQDIALIPMLVVLEFFGKGKLESGEVFLSIIGGLLLLNLIYWVLKHDEVKLPFTRFIPEDHETQVLLALTVCFGLAVIGSLFGLSAAIGAFVAGVVVSSAKQTKWVHRVLEPFRVVFVALFFIYVGLIIDLSFIRENIALVIAVVLIVFVFNTIMNAVILRLLGGRWPGSIYGGALLSEIGEFSFLIGLVGWQAGLVPFFGYQLITSVIALTLLLSPLWIMTVKKLILIKGHSLA